MLSPLVISGLFRKVMAAVPRRPRGRPLLAAIVAPCSVLATGLLVPGPASAEPAMQRLRVATFAAPDLARVERDYTRWLGYTVRERGKVSAALAASWDAPRAAGRPYVLLSSTAHPDVFIRAVRVAAMPGYRPITTHGWNGIEIIVDDTDKTFERLAGSPFKVIGEPAQGRPMGGAA